MKTTDAVHYFGGATALSRALGIRREAIYQWGEDVPVRRAYELERITGGLLKAPELPSDPKHRLPSENAA